MAITQKEITHIQQTLKQIQDSVNLVNTTTKPDVFFKRLNMTLDFMLYLMPYDKKKIFIGKSMKQNYNEIIGDLDNIVNRFIDRAIEENRKKLSSLKSENAKKSNYEKFVISMISAFDCANSFWTGNFSKNKILPHYTGALYTKENYIRIHTMFTEFTQNEI